MKTFAERECAVFNRWTFYPPYLKELLILQTYSIRNKHDNKYIV